MAASLLIKNGLLLDGTGAPGKIGDLRIEQGLITDVGGTLEPRSGEEIVDASGAVVAPGMIDSHSHSDLDLLKHPRQDFDLCQGVTTQIVGLCGLGYIPLSGDKLDENMRYSAGLFGYDRELASSDIFSSFAAYMDAVKGAGTNVCVSATHNAARIAANGFSSTIPDRIEYFRRMQKILADAVEAGCIGMSTGLSYYPCAYADYDELVFLADTLKELDAAMLSHIRYPRQGEPDSAIEEFLRIGTETGARIHILHYRTKYPYDAGQPQRLLSMVRSANENGADITLESMPYLSGSTFIHAILPGWAVDGGYEAALASLRDPEKRRRIKEEMQYLKSITCMGNGKPPRFGHVGNHPEYSGAFIRDVQEKRGQDLDEMLLDLMLESGLDINYVGNEAENDPEIDRILMDDTLTLLQDPLYLCGGDAMPYGEYQHPRTFGCYARMLRFSREKKIPLEKVIKKLTLEPAERFHLNSVGKLETGRRGDVIIFDPDTVSDRATFDDPFQTAQGFRYTIVGGSVAVKDDVPTGVLNGSVIKMNEGRS